MPNSCCWGPRTRLWTPCWKAFCRSWRQTYTLYLVGPSGERGPLTTRCLIWRCTNLMARDVCPFLSQNLKVSAVIAARCRSFRPIARSGEVLGVDDKVSQMLCGTPLFDYSHFHWCFWQAEIELGGRAGTEWWEVLFYPQQALSGPSWLLARSFQPLMHGSIWLASRQGSCWCQMNLERLSR